MWILVNPIFWRTKANYKDKFCGDVSRIDMDKMK